MGIRKIHGYQRDGHRISSQDQRMVVKEVLLVEADSPLDTLNTIVTALPSFASGPGTMTFNPLQITFTRYQSVHKDATNLTLEDVNEGRRAPKGGNFWLFPLTYATQGFYGVGVETPQNKKKSQKVKKPDSSNQADQEPITDPSERPPIFSGSSRIVQRKSFFDLNDDLIKHTNTLPVSKPVTIPVMHKNWRWTWNINVEDYDEADFDVIANKANSIQLMIPMGNGSHYTVVAGKLKCLGFAIQEAWETPSGTTTEFHYVRVTGRFELSFDKWNLAPLSMHTKQKVAAGILPIKINARGDEAKEPWPLFPAGDAMTANDIATAAPGAFGRLQAGGANLKVCEEIDFTAFFNTHKLTLPQVMN